MGWKFRSSDPWMLVRTLILGVALLVPGVPAQNVEQAFAQAQPPTVSVTLSAEGEPAEPVPGTGLARSGGLVLQITLTNSGISDVADLTVRALVPARAHVTDSWVGRPGQGAATVGGRLATWTGLTVPRGGQLGPLSYRLAPDAGADGAVTFRDATVAPEVSWTRPVPDRIASTPLRLNGLWSEGSLRRTLLPSGLTVFTRERPDTATVALLLAVRAGSRDEDAATRGGSHWLEHAHFLGTTRRPVAQMLDEEIESVGGLSNASTGWESTTYWSFVPAEHFDRALDVLADELQNSTFPAEAFERERRVVFEELKDRRDTPTIRATDEFLNAVFQVSPLRQHPAGTIESVQAIPIETILAYRRRLYITGNIAIAAAGRLRHDETVAKIERAFARLPLGPRSVRPAVPEPVQIEPRLVSIGERGDTAEIRLGWPVPGDDSMDSPALFVLNDLLGSTGLRLAEALQEREALASSADSSYLVFSDAGALLLSASTRADLAPRVSEALLEQIRQVRAGAITDADVRDSIQALTGRRALGEETNLAQVGGAEIDVSGVLDSFDEYVARLRRVSAADIQRVAQRWLDPANHTLVIVRS